MKIHVIKLLVNVNQKNKSTDFEQIMFSKTT